MVSRALRELRETKNQGHTYGISCFHGDPRDNKSMPYLWYPVFSRGLREHEKSRPYLWYPVLSWGSESINNPSRTYGIPCSHGAQRASKIKAVPMVSCALRELREHQKHETRNLKPKSRLPTPEKVRNNSNQKLFEFLSTSVT